MVATVVDVYVYIVRVGFHSECTDRCIARRVGFGRLGGIRA
jgi:hypothetical protein